MVSLFTVGITEFQNTAANSPRKKKNIFTKSHPKTSSDIPHSGSLTTGMKKRALSLQGTIIMLNICQTLHFISLKFQLQPEKNPSIKFPFLDKPAALRWVLHEHVLAPQAPNFECNNLFNHNLTLLIPV